MTSPFLNLPLRSEQEVRERRAKLEADMRAEGAHEAEIARLATDDTAEKMLAYERKTLAFIQNVMFGAR